MTQGKLCKICKKRTGGIPVAECPVCAGSGYEEAPRLYANQRENDESISDFITRLTGIVAEDPNRFLSRGMVVRFEKEMDDHRYDIWHTAKRLHEIRKSGRHVRNPDACVSFGRTCEYFDVCTGTASLDDPTLFQIKKSANPELANG